MSSNLENDNELLSNCCSAKAHGEIDEATSTGRCSDCGDGCLFVTNVTMTNNLEEVLSKYRVLLCDVAENGNDGKYQAQNHPTQYTRSNVNGYFGELEKALVALINQKEKELLDRFEEAIGEDDEEMAGIWLDGVFHEGSQNNRVRNELRKKQRSRIKQLKEEGDS